MNHAVRVPMLSGKTMVAGVVGRPIGHSLSPRLHNAWIAAAGIDAVYVPFSPTAAGFAALIEGLRGGAVRGLNVTLPFKEAALAAADQATALASASGAANLLLFQYDGTIEARNTDGTGLLYAFRRQAPAFDIAAGPVVILGAGGAARGAIAALQQAGVPDIRVVNRTLARAQSLTQAFAGVSAFSLEQWPDATEDAGAIINATSAEIGGGAGLNLNFSHAPPGVVAMDMLYRPLKTEFLKRAERCGLRTVDGLDMLIGQAIPSFEALFGIPPPDGLDARALLLDAMEPGR